MLELLDLDKQIPKETYEQVYPDLETRLGACQRAARASGVPVVIVFEGWDAAGKGKIINRLVQAIESDPFRGIGKPEPLRHELAGYWSRRITEEHRLVYKVAGKTAHIISCRYHYSKK